MDIHQRRCPNYSNNVDISVDGISENKSSINVMDVYTARFKGCRVIYPLQIIRPIGKFKVDYRKYLDKFLTDICSCSCRISCFIGDNPKRAQAREALGHSSYYPCEYCACKGTLFHLSDISITQKKKKLLASQTMIQSQIDANDSDTDVEHLNTALNNLKEAHAELSKKRGHIVWPKSSFGMEPRSEHDIRDITERLSNDETLTRDEKKGFVGKSLFLDIPYFQFVFQMPAEYLHGVCLGVTKMLLQLTFSVGENRKRITNRKLSSPLQFNLMISVIKVPFEFPRRVRSLDFSVMKGAEFRNILLFFFKIVYNCIEEGAPERKLWLLFTYMIRSCVIPEAEFNAVDQDQIWDICLEFYTLYESLFGVSNCTYYTHIVCCHLLQIRTLGPLTESSAFPFESFYGEVRNSFVPGTASPLKQIMQKVLLKRAIGSHSCKESIFYSEKDTNMQCNNLIYLYENETYHLFKIQNIENGFAQCLKINVQKATFPETPNLNWEKVGVFEQDSFGGAENVELKNVHGKVIKVDNLLITCPANVLREK